ncbi:hypothetical_protein [Candidozyma auris]|nr:TFIIH complex kinase subunit CCL1 [[Candida] auris]QEO23146.1 hypothetical_protein [[Candida] auris]GBL49195.1 putative cyclin ccl1 [[Candida] auris]
MTESETDGSSAESTVPKQKTTVSIDDLYRRSSQYQLWSFTSDELDHVKKSTYENGRMAAIERFEETKEKMSLEKGEVFAQHADKLTSDKVLDLITFDEQQKYLQFFAQQILQTCAHFRMPTQVKATAVAFFQRFYLHNSPMTYHPKNIVFTCVFLAAKSENYFISIDSFCSLLPKTEKSDILNLEFDVLQSLRFTLLVHHPFRPLYGFFLDLQQVLMHPTPVMYDVNIDTIGTLYDEAKKWLNDYALLSDVAFLFTPPQIALAALYDCNKRVTNRYLKIKFSKSNDGTHLESITEEDPEETSEGKGENMDTKATDPENKVSQKPHGQSPVNLYEELVKTIRRCISVAKTKIETSREECIEIDKKCVYVLNPGKVLKKKLKALSSETVTN